MKVNIRFESISEEGEKTISNIFAVMEVRKYDFRLVYVEDLSGNGNMTKSTMVISPDGMRIIRTGELNTDFMYGKELTHNTTYGTPYGNMPVTIETKNYEFSLVSKDNPDIKLGVGGVLTDDFIMSCNTVYTLFMGDESPMKMGINITITRTQ